jgi:hypothetical protein
MHALSRLRILGVGIPSHELTFVTRESQPFFAGWICSCHKTINIGFLIIIYAHLMKEALERASSVRSISIGLDS